MHKQLLLFHNAISAYFAGNQQQLEQTLKQFNIKLRPPGADKPSWLEEQWEGPCCWTSSCSLLLDHHRSTCSLLKPQRTEDQNRGRTRADKWVDEGEWDDCEAGWLDRWVDDESQGVGEERADAAGNTMPVEWTVSLGAFYCLLIVFFFFSHSNFVLVLRSLPSFSPFSHLLLRLTLH